MPVMPKRTKYRKMQKGRNRGKATRGNKVTEGEFGIQALEGGLITANQIESARIAMTRFIKRGGKVWIKIFPDKPISKKPAETRMGKGKGAVEYWVAVVKPGRVMFEIAGIPEKIAKEALRLAMYKLPIKTKFIVKEGFIEGVTKSIWADYVEKEISLEPETAVVNEEATEDDTSEENKVGGDSDEDK